VDTGAAFTSVATELIPAAVYQGSPVEMLGAQGSLSSAVRVGPLRFEIAGRPMVDIAPLAMDLGHFSQIEGVEISGILGYSVLGRSSLKIDLRNGTLEFEKPR
jgi:hypothetical protein